MHDDGGVSDQASDMVHAFKDTCMDLQVNFGYERYIFDMLACSSLKVAVFSTSSYINDSTLCACKIKCSVSFVITGFYSSQLYPHLFGFFSLVIIIYLVI